MCTCNYHHTSKMLLEHASMVMSMGGHASIYLKNISIQFKNIWSNYTLLRTLTALIFFHILCTTLNYFPTHYFGTYWLMIVRAIADIMIKSAWEDLGACVEVQLLLHRYLPFQHSNIFSEQIDNLVSNVEGHPEDPMTVIRLNRILASDT